MVGYSVLFALAKFERQLARLEADSPLLGALLAVGVALLAIFVVVRVVRAARRRRRRAQVAQPAHRGPGRSLGSKNKSPASAEEFEQAQYQRAVRRLQRTDPAGYNAYLVALLRHHTGQDSEWTPERLLESKDVWRKLGYVPVPVGEGKTLAQDVVREVAPQLPAIVAAYRSGRTAPMSSTAPVEASGADDLSEPSRAPTAE